MRQNSIRPLCAVAALVAVLACTLTGCKSTPNPYETPPPTRSLLEIKHHVGGTHYRTLVHDGTWYQTFSNALVILDDRAVVQPGGSNVIDTIELAEFGTCGPATDMALRDNTLYVLLERDQVIEFSLADPWAPKERRRLNAQQLGIRPTRLSVVDDQVYISGHGGIVKLVGLMEPLPKAARKNELLLAPGVAPIVTASDELGPVAQTPQGLITTIGRRIVSVPGLKYLGSANEVIALPTGLGGPDLVAYVWRGSEGTIVGLMGSDLRERSRKSFIGDVHRVKPMDGKLWVVTDDAIVACAVEGDELVEAHRIGVYGARDVAPLSENYLAVAGTFGRSIYRIATDGFGPGDTFLAAHREPSGLENSTYDGRFVLAGSHEGYWLYEIERGVSLAQRTVMHPTETSRSAKTLRGSATLDESGAVLTVTIGGETHTYSAPHGSRMLCIEAVGGDVWIGHEHGLIVLSGEATDAEVRAELTIPGPIVALYPLRVGGGATYVSELGGFGVVRWIIEQIPYEK
jgi:hypothetical protein